MQNISSVDQFVLEMMLILEILDLKGYSHIWPYAEMPTFENQIWVKRELSKPATHLL